MSPHHILPAVSCIIFNERREVLLQKRRDTGRWCIVSGKVEFGESVQDAILREVWEETETRSEIVRLIGVYSSPAYSTYRYADRTVQYVVSYFEVKLLAAIPPGLSNAEAIAFEYFHPERLPADIDLVNPFWLSDALDPTAAVFVR